jgi:hypothetical protein
MAEGVNSERRMLNYCELGRRIGRTGGRRSLGAALSDAGFVGPLRGTAAFQVAFICLSASR